MNYLERKSGQIRYDLNVTTQKAFSRTFMKYLQNEIMWGLI